jgi:hypothetical protein
LIERINQMDRNMWCTGGFLHAAGLTVTRDRQIVPLGDRADTVFTFEPIEVACTKDAVTHWKNTTTKTNRFLFHVKDVDRYPAAMTASLVKLLRNLP